MAVNEQIGKLDRFITIKQFTETVDEYNSPVRTEATVKNVWAQVRFKSSTEDFAQKVFDIDKRDYVIHYDVDVTSLNLKNLAVLDGTQLYYVTGVNVDFGGRNKYVLLNCEYRG